LGEDERQGGDRQMRVVLQITPTSKLLIADVKTAGRMLQPFEHEYTACIIVDTKGLEIRMFERLEQGNTKYAIHRERMDADFKVPEIDQATEKQFVGSFMKTWVKDKTDYRKAARLALKSLKPVFE
jgi:hypothetical protein